MERQICSALKAVIISDLRQAYLHMDVVEFKDLLTEIKAVIQSYEDDTRSNVIMHS